MLDHLLLLLDDGSLMVLKYSQVVQRFYIAAEVQLAAGAVAWPAVSTHQAWFQCGVARVLYRPVVSFWWQRFHCSLVSSAKPPDGTECRAWMGFSC